MATQPTPGTQSGAQSIILEPGAPGAFVCFGDWENVRSCSPIGEAEDPLDGCSQAYECRKFTLEQNPPTTRFRVKPRRDGRFEIQQFRDFIREQTSYHMEISKGNIVITYPGERNVPKSKRFFLHVKHVQEATLDIDGEFELVMSLDQMVLRQAGSGPVMGTRPQRREEEDPEARRRRIADKLRKKASKDARAEDEDDDLELDLDIELDDLDLEVDDDDDDEVEEDAAADDSVEVAEEPVPAGIVDEDAKDEGPDPADQDDDEEG